MAGYGEEAVAGMAIVGRLIPVAFGVIFALSGAVGPIIGQNYGAGQHDRVRGAFRDAMINAGLAPIAIDGHPDDAAGMRKLAAGRLNAV